MQEVSLSGSSRANVGKKDAKAVRAEGMVPAVVYGGDKEHHISVRHVDMKKLIFSPNVRIINLDVDGTSIKAIIQDTQIHPVTDQILHVDLIELKDDKKVKISIPVNLVGRPIGVINGGKLAQVFRKLKVYALPGDLPDTIDIDISNMRIGTAMRIKDLDFEGLTFLHSPDNAICTVKMARGAVEEEEEEEEGAEGEEGEGGEGAPAEGGGDAAPAEGGGDE